MNNNPLLQAYPDEWPIAQELLPAYLKKTLSSSDQAWMETWINQVKSQAGDGALQLERELHFAHLLQTQLSAPSVGLDVQGSWDKLSASISQPSASPAHNLAPKPRHSPSLQQRMQDILGQFMTWWSRQWVAIAVCALLAAHIGLLSLLAGGSDSTRIPAIAAPASGNSAPASGVIYRVAFKPEAKAQEILGLLLRMQAQIIAGPSALGLWSIQVENSQALAAEQLLKHSSLVETYSLD
ncbi:MAG: hypothetical protein HC765_13035 [Brachymonas sp.]|nr:hypothetical protein [Brachymonas sp.]